MIDASSLAKSLAARQGTLMSKMKMEKPMRFGLLATLALHAASVAVWQSQSTNMHVSSAPAHEERVMQVQFRSPPRDAPAGPQSVSPTAVPEPAVEMIADSQLKAGTMDKAEDDSSPFAILPILRVQEAPYLSAGELDEPARPQEPVIVPFPDEPLQTGRAAGVLVLYIGADGKVDRVEVDEADWSPGFEKVAIETFMQAKMQPGIKDGKTSRSRMKILVEFEGQ
ncbi:hypothetical protein D3870_13135 [Noviherbaspirillum cavernae]|uniref:TonB C-terminal domain-containing protein n=2 Tax=Noviherbaspirillum cavernae TaxID=2320862 RepID=A0A418X2Y6_9BURK|nr:hypothetical protein D3870_13135 [Noviherbaspirillum cavernae]